MKAIDFVKKFYNEPHRRFHTTEHVYDVLANLPKNKSQELYYAVIFHDSFYDPGNQDNEENSCIVFRYWALYNNTEIDADRVCELIMATKNPFQRFSDKEKKILSDADMRIFMRSQEELIKYEEQIRYEFQKYTSEEYKKDRIEFLKEVQNFYGHMSVQGTNCQFLIDYINKQ